MTRQDFITYLRDNGCILVRADKKGYTVIRNVVSGQISGVPASDPCFDSTICRICKTLGIEPPACSLEIMEIIEKAHNKYG